MVISIHHKKGIDITNFGISVNTKAWGGCYVFGYPIKSSSVLIIFLFPHLDFEIMRADLLIFENVITDYIGIGNKLLDSIETTIEFDTEEGILSLNIIYTTIY